MNSLEDSGGFIVEEIEDCPSDHGEDSPIVDDNNNDSDNGDFDKSLLDLKSSSFLSRAATETQLSTFQHDFNALFPRGDASSSVPRADGNKELHLLQVNAANATNPVINYQVYMKPQEADQSLGSSGTAAPPSPPPRLDLPSYGPESTQGDTPVFLRNIVPRPYSNRLLFLQVFSVLVMIVIILYKLNDLLHTTDNVLHSVTSTVDTFTSPIQTCGLWIASTVSAIMGGTTSSRMGSTGGDGNGDGRGKPSNGRQRGGGGFTASTDHGGDEEDDDEYSQPAPLFSSGEAYLHRIDNIIQVGHRLQQVPAWHQNNAAEMEVLVDIGLNRDKLVEPAVQKGSKVDADIRKEIAAERRRARALNKEVWRVRDRVERLRATVHPDHKTSTPPVQQHSHQKHRKQLQWWRWVAGWFGFPSNTEELSILEDCKALVQEASALLLRALEKRESWKGELDEIIPRLKNAAGPICDLAELAHNAGGSSPNRHFPEKKYGQLSSHLGTLSYNTCQMNGIIKPDLQDRDDVLVSAKAEIQAAVHEEAKDFLKWIEKQQQLVRKSTWDDMEHFLEGLTSILDWSSEQVRPKKLWGTRK